MIKVAVAGLALAVICISAQATPKLPWEEYDKLVQKAEAIAPYRGDLFGDKHDPMSGGLSFSQTDIDIPGNSGLQVSLTRTLLVSNRRGYLSSATGSSTRQEGMFADWDLDLPHITGVFAPTWTDARCSSATPPPSVRITEQGRTTYFHAEDYWQGLQAKMPGGGELVWAPGRAAEIPRPQGGSHLWTTTGGAFFSCLQTTKNSAGEGFLAVAPDGTRYWFDWMAQYYEPNLKAGRSSSRSISRRRNALFATRVEDRFGNWISYTYSNSANVAARLTSVASSDGRNLSITYNPQGYIALVSDGQRSWTYEYSYPDASTATLVSVLRADGSRWQFDLSALANASFRYVTPAPSAEEAYRDCANPGDIYDEAPISGVITHPSGAVGRFTVAAQRFGRSNVPLICANYSRPHNDPNDDIAYYAVAWDSFALVGKSLSGAGIPAQTWSYSYFSSISWALHPSGGGHPVCGSGANCSPPSCVSDHCAGTTRVTIVEPDLTTTVHTFGNSYRYNEGKLLGVSRFDADGRPMQQQSYRYVLVDNGQCYSKPLGKSQLNRAGFTSEYFRPQDEAITLQDGMRFRSAVSAFDCLARPLIIEKSSGPAT